MNVIIYVRSSIKNDEAIREQLVKISAYATENGHTIIDTYIDNGYSGRKLRRPRLRALIKRIKKDNVEGVIIYSMDRLSRSLKHTKYFINEVCSKNNTQLLSIKDNFETNDLSRILQLLNLKIK